MTTTVSSMEETIKALRETGKDFKIVVGGAVLTREYADMIGADCYAPDALATVNYAKKILGHCSHRPAHKFAFVRKVTGHVAQMRDRVACP